jgi:nucleotide-binding universal stress UspA family protein
MQFIRSIVHATDLSNLSTPAFVHALRIALAAQTKLYSLHVKQNGTDSRSGFPDVRRLVAQWGLLEEDEPLSAGAAKQGLRFENVTLDRREPSDAILQFIDQHVCDLVVLATHGRDGIDHWLNGSIAEKVFSRSAISTLFVPRGARGFVDQVTGDFRLRHVLVPVDHTPTPDRAIKATRDLVHLLTGPNFTMQLVHVGIGCSAIQSSISHLEGSTPITIRYGNVVQTIVDAAIEYDVDLICMPTAGHHGILDAMRGSTTERVIRQAPCPVLAVPSA